MAANTAFFPTLMWNSRFASLSGDPFDNIRGFIFPNPEGASLSYQPQLLVAQAFIPPTERVEVAGFTFPGDPSDPAHEHALIRGEVLNRLNGIAEYRELFGKSFASVNKVSEQRTADSAESACWRTLQSRRIRSAPTPAVMPTCPTGVGIGVHGAGSRLIVRSGGG